MESILLKVFSTILIAVFTILIEGFLLFLETYSNVPIAISAILTTAATFLIWRVSSKQTKYMYLMGKAAEQPIITINYIVEYLRDYVSRNSRGGRVYMGNDRVLTILLSNIGKGSAYKLKIEQRGQKTKEIDMLIVGQKHEYFVLAEDIRSKEISPTVKVTYQDIFENEYTIED